MIMLLASVEQYTNHQINTGWYITIVSSILITGLISAFFLNRTANSVLSYNDNKTTHSLNNSTEKLILQVAGIYFIVTALAQLPRSLSFLVQPADLYMQSFMFPAGLLFQLIIGLWLISNSSFWLGLLQKLRGRQ
ncbi:hypothetical protein [Parendozoicomonas sp. Alg238-R29]|uniref:hypothetical protein n=1 Tax=Parendozoicomonas sp. Alg238-R29 TaxID=2993446 RepID=UPI00248EDFF6|nr:hypothetical protein [Parendozoicomonas sp. Alg238-R29]